MPITTTYDREADVCYVRFGDGARSVATTQVVAPGIQLDRDAAGRVLGLEILQASTRVPDDALRDAGDPVEWLTLAEAGAYAGRSPSTLRVLLNTGKLEGQKRGRDWLVARHVLENYAERVYARLQRAEARAAAPPSPRQRTSTRTR
jgi:uncharacterized protein YuzE